ncbi:unnamed protein product [Sphagnum jensenii]
MSPVSMRGVEQDRRCGLVNHTALATRSSTVSPFVYTSRCAATSRGFPGFPVSPPSPGCCASPTGHHPLVVSILPQQRKPVSMENS